MEASHPNDVTMRITVDPNGPAPASAEARASIAGDHTVTFQG